MDRERKTSLICISAILLILFGIPAIAWYVLFCPHTEYFFFDREKLGNDFHIDLTDDVRIVSYTRCDMFLDIDYKLVIEVDDPESFVRNNVREKTELYEKESAGKVYRHFIYGSPQVTAYVEPHGDKYRILMTYFA